MMVDEATVATSAVPVGADELAVLDLAEAAVETVASGSTDYGRFLRSAGKLAVARQVSALLLVASILALPALADQSVATAFVWGYFAMMTLSSLLGFGLERLAGTVVGARGEQSVARALAPVLTVRLITIPLGVPGMAVLFALVGVGLAPSAWVATFVWLAAAMIAPLVFGALRVVGSSTVEPVTMIAVRVAQASALVALAVHGAPVGALLGAVAILECAGVVVGLVTVGELGSSWGAWTRFDLLPARQGASLAGIEVLGVLYLRADLVLVGHFLGATPGATYGLLYRAVDSFSGVVSSVGLWLFAESANGHEGGVDPAGVRARTLRMLPVFGLLSAVLVVGAAGILGDLVPSVASEASTLRVLAIAFPLLCLNAVELHVRTGRGRTSEILAITATVLAVNVPLCIVAIEVFGMIGAAATLVITEALQSALLWKTSSRDERALVGRALTVAVLGTTALGVATLLTAAGGW